MCIQILRSVLAAEVQINLGIMLVPTLVSSSTFPPSTEVLYNYKFDWSLKKKSLVTSSTFIEKFEFLYWVSSWLIIYILERWITI